ncbi:MAG: UvrD-helicase domain-containing protein [Candidatus Peregrinibacteria bacterium]|nr:UvrD-helicase domain-containing protein [Candidatus Peregrinibacteria bacterium]MCB9808175.1 UvrD-helicase domain-containing protein [Candidatus Peribacteria bacterium]
MITQHLNEPQQQAVMNTEGPLLILAGAGSGKTKALTHRIAHLMETGVPPWQILAVTFTNKAAAEMKERIENLLHIQGTGPFDSTFGLAQGNGQSGRLPITGTFHSICARILRRDIDKIGRERTFVIYDSDDQQRLMKEILKEMGIDDKELKPKAALGYIGRFKCEALTPRDAGNQATTARMHQVIDAYKRYQQELFKANALDFDDLILETIRLFTEVPEVLDRYQNTWRYLHVDEYQDTNHAQYLFISLLAKRFKNLCVIGDPDQSIYAFRGADIRNILEFEKEYPEAKRIKLEQNYRSTQIILDAADGVIDANPNRPEKKMWSEKKEGPKVVVQELGDEKKEALEAVKVASELHRTKGIAYNEQVVLYRTNAQSRLFEEACLRFSIPYRIVGGLKFYARKEVKDVLAYLHVILNPFDTIALLRIINVPARKIGLTTMGKIQDYASGNIMSLWDALRSVHMIEGVNAPTKERIAHFVELIERFQEKAKTETVAELTGHLLHAIDMEHWLRDDTEEGETRWENVLELQSVMQKYDALEPHQSLMSFLEEVSLVSEVDKLQDTNSDALTLMTLHLCKGLEFDHVIVAGCEEGIFPHSNSMFDKEQLEEERRLLYVGMTRARKHLRLMLTRSRILFGQSQANAPSRFLDDLPDAVTERRSDDVLSAFAWASKNAERKIRGEDPHGEFNQDIDFSDDMNQDLELLEGSRIAHPTFGKGTVVAIRGDIIDIKFDQGGRRTLALSIAPLKII